MGTEYVIACENCHERMEYDGKWVNSLSYEKDLAKIGEIPLSFVLELARFLWLHSNKNCDIQVNDWSNIQEWPTVSWKELSFWEDSEILNTLINSNIKEENEYLKEKIEGIFSIIKHRKKIQKTYLDISRSARTKEESLKFQEELKELFKIKEELYEKEVSNRRLESELLEAYKMKNAYQELYFKEIKKYKGKIND